MEIIVYLVVTAIILIMSIRWMADADWCFTYWVENHAKLIERGGSRNATGLWVGGVFDHMIAEVEGYVVDGHIIRPVTALDQENLSWLNRQLRRMGVYFFGLSPLGYHVKNFYVKKDKENVTGTNPATWITPGERVLVTALRVAFPRPFVFTDVELADRLKVHLKVVGKLRIVDPYIVLYHYTDDFFNQAASILQGFVIDRLARNGVTIGSFLSMKKGFDNGLLTKYQAIDSKLNIELLKQIGAVFTSLANNDWEPGDADIVRAIQLAGIRTAEGDANIIAANKAKEVTVITANAYEERVGIETRADVARQNALAVSRSNYVRQTTSALVLPGADANVVSRGAADVLEMEAATGSTSKITTLVKDGRKTVVPIGDKP